MKLNLLAHFVRPWFFFGPFVLLTRGVVAAPPIDYDRDVRPILSENCFKCHGFDAGQRQAGLRLDTPEGATRRLPSGRTALTPRSLTASEIVERLRASDSRQMPPVYSRKHVTPAEIKIIERWIAQGAKYDPHWAFVAPKRPMPPVVKRISWPRNAVDRFVLAKQEAAGLTPSTEADKRTLIRRLSFDLTGLPPTPAECATFVADKRSDAYERLVDRLLASPHYGERMALQWLDLARYADTHGFHIDSGREMWPWRDWVINAFNQNKSYDQFIVEQLAGDLLPHATRDQRVATGFNRNHPIDFEGGAIPEEYQTAYIVDRIDTTATAFMGLTMRCAQCHDHKYDPISQKEYYRFYAFFNNITEKGLDGNTGNAVPYLKLPTSEQQASLDAFTSRIAALEASTQPREKTFTPQVVNWTRIALRIGLLTDTPSPEQSEALTRAYVAQHDTLYKQQIADLDEIRRKMADLDKSIPTTMVMEEREKQRDTFLLIRGQYDHLGEKVTCGVPAMLPPLPAGVPANRLALARWLVAPNHPLTARVAVNHFWQMLFGNGLVRTAENFGLQGERPTHPELLDWLATEFVRSGWKVRAMMRLLVTSATYRQSSVQTPLLRERDPENRLLARAPRFRLCAEMIRDQALAQSGLLVPKIGGPSVKPYQPEGLWEEISFKGSFSQQYFVQDHGEALYRRSMYTFWKRTCPPPALQIFDAPEREFCLVRRSVTNTPLQALTLMNDPTYMEASRKLAERIMTEGGLWPAQRIRFAFLLLLSRPPTSREQSILLSHYEKQLGAFHTHPDDARKLLSIGESKRKATLEASELAAWTTVASILLNLDETITRG